MKFKRIHSALYEFENYIIKHSDEPGRNKGHQVLFDGQVIADQVTFKEAKEKAQEHKEWREGR